MSDQFPEYDALTSAAALVHLPRRTTVRLTGADRVDFLHNLTTNDVRALTPNSGCEAFLLNASGKILAYVNVFAHDDHILLDSTGDHAERIINHLDRYLIREQVELTDASADLDHLLLAGPAAYDRLASHTSDPLPEKLLASTTARIADHPVTVRRVDFTSPADFLLELPTDSVAGVVAALDSAGIPPCGADAYEVARIERGTPHYDADITDANLPQEVARDDRIISFTKGCYIGQETVARIDALGHVNQTLLGLRFHDSTPPSPGAEITVDGKTVARLTSVTDSPRADGPFALAYVRRAHAAPGTELDTDAGRVTVTALPLE